MKATLFLVAMMGLGLSTVGCLQSATNEELAALDLVGYAPQENPTGSDTSNHHSFSDYHGNKYKLLAAMDHALGTQVCSNGNCFYSASLSSSIYDTGILDTSEGQDLFQTAIECALADGDRVSQSNASRTYTGKGLMGTTAGWFSGALSTDQKEDVFRCVIARVNAFGLSVPILISGQNVTNQPDEDHSGRNWQPDALWDVEISWSGAVPVISEYAWSLADAGSAAPQCPSVLTPMEARVCDLDSSICGFNVRDTAASDCYTISSPQTSADIYRCTPDHPGEGRPVVQSWVDANGSGIPYTDCSLN